MLLNLDKLRVLAEHTLGTVPIHLTECRLGDTLGLLLVIPIPRGTEYRLVIFEPLGIKNYLERIRQGEVPTIYSIFADQGTKKYPSPLHNGPNRIYWNFQNPGSAVGALILAMCGLKNRIDWSKVKVDEILGPWLPVSGVFPYLESLLLPEPEASS